VAPETDELIGVAQILNRREGTFTETDEHLATVLAVHCAVAMRRTSLVEDRLRLAVVDRALDLAREIQQKTFPTDFTAPEGWSCFGWSMPADRTGGDTFDIVNAGSSMHLLVGDATGHGIGPALSVSQVRSMLRMAARLSAEPIEVIRHLNAQLFEDSANARFVTAWFGHVEARSGRLVSIAMGQGPLLLIRASGEISTFDADAPPLGVMPELFVEKPTILELGPGDLFVVPTDGIMEAVDSSGTEYGVERMVNILRDARTLPLEELLQLVHDDTEAFHNGSKAADDRTVLALRREP
jgi:phosphoserine phosphatase